MRAISSKAWAGLIFAAALSPVTIFIKLGAALGNADAKLAYTGMEALINSAWIGVVAIIVGGACLYAMRKLDYLKSQVSDLTAKNQSLTRDLALHRDGNDALSAHAASISERVNDLYKLRIRDGSVYRGQEQVTLTPRQFQLLSILMQKNEELCRTDDILQEMYGNAFDRQALNQLISRLRSELNVHEYIRRNENNLGYSFAQWASPLSFV